VSEQPCSNLDADQFCDKTAAMSSFVKQYRVLGGFGICDGKSGMLAAVDNSL
jgi:hypothetical protein